MKAARVLAAAAVIAGVVGVSANVNPNINDVALLNYALQLEDLELAFYTKGLGQYANSDFTAANISTTVRDYMVLIQAHEQAHVNFITNAITASAANGGYGATAGQNCSAYSFSSTGFTSVADFVSQAITLEDVGVSAYTGGLNTITNEAVQQAAATIATVEARHASFLRQAVGIAAKNTSIPFPDALNQARTPAQVLAVAGSYFTTCSYDVSANIPTIRPAGVASTTTAAAAMPTSATPTNPAPTYTQKQFNDDVAVLNYALTLEHLEADFYNTFNGRFSASDFESATGLAAGQGAIIISNVGLVRAHENAHVDALTGLITGRSATPVTAGCYDWSSITTAAQFLSVAATLENTGVSAYDGAANNITDTGLQQIAASVATVEARHAAYLNVLNKQSASQQSYMNGNFDQALTPTQIVGAVTALPYARALTGGCNSTTSSSSSSGHAAGASSSTGNNNGASMAAPAMIVSAALAFVAALLF